MTDHYAVMGYPVAHSKSPYIHAAFAEQTGQNLDYRALLVEPGTFPARALQFFAEGGKGLNITVPFKQEAWELAGVRSQQAELAGAVNTLLQNADGSVHGHNTDGTGLVRDIMQNHGGHLRGASSRSQGRGDVHRVCVPWCYNLNLSYLRLLCFLRARLFHSLQFQDFNGADHVAHGVAQSIALVCDDRGQIDRAELGAVCGHRGACFTVEHDIHMIGNRAGGNRAAGQRREGGRQPLTILLMAGHAIGGVDGLTLGHELFQREILVSQFGHRCCGCLFFGKPGIEFSGLDHVHHDRHEAVVLSAQFGALAPEGAGLLG